jgi:hypothetical protein
VGAGGLVEGDFLSRGEERGGWGGVKDEKIE